MAPTLSKRLSCLADMAGGFVLADIGTDHAYLPIYLILTGKIRRAYAMDIGTGPLSRAKEHIAAYGLGDYITLRLSDGLSGLKPKEAESILIAGMGGDVMLGILRQGKPVVEAAKELILQPQSNIHKVREHLYRMGYAIDREEIVLEDGKYYPMFHVDLGKTAPKEGAYSPQEWQMAYRYGEPRLICSKELLQRYLMHKIERYRNIEENLQRQPKGRDILERRQEIAEELAYAKGALEHLEVG